MSVNKVILLGYVGSDPKSDILKKDKPVAFMSLATNERYANSTAEVTEWHSLVMGGKNAESLLRNTSAKGSRLYVEGKLRTRGIRRQNENPPPQNRNYRRAIRTSRSQERTSRLVCFIINTGSPFSRQLNSIAGFIERMQLLKTIETE